MQTLKDRRDKVLSSSLSLSYSSPLTIVRGEGQYLYDANGRQYLDCVNNVCHVGHCHPAVVAAGQQQMATLNTNTRYLHPAIIELGERLLDTFPDPLSTCFFVNSGSEANELALRIARAHTKNREIIVLEHGYHGNTQGLIDVSHYKFAGKGGEGPGPATTVSLLPDPYRGKFQGSTPDVLQSYLSELEQLLENLKLADKPPAAFLAESISGCGGQVFFPEGYLRMAAELIRSAGGVYIADEVQVGFGRVGDSWWAFEADGVVPDIVTMGKPMGNGHPIAAVVTTREIADSFNTGMEYFNTFGGNPVSAVIAKSVLSVLEAEGLKENARDVGNYFIQQLQSLKEKHAEIGDVRGRGLFIGVDLVTCRESKEPATQLAQTIVDLAQSKGVLLSTDGPGNNVLKIKPPLVINRGDVDTVLKVLQAALVEVKGRA